MKGSTAEDAMTETTITTEHRPARDSASPKMQTTKNKVAIEMAVFRHQMEMEREALIHQLQTALAQVKALSGLLPICAQCKKVRDDGGYWSQVEAYIEQRTEARFSHGLCPICFDTAMARHRQESLSRR